MFSGKSRNANPFSRNHWKLVKKYDFYNVSSISTRNRERRKHNMRWGRVSMLLTAILPTLRFHGLWDSFHLQFSGKPCDLHLWFELSQVRLGRFQGRTFMLLLHWIKSCRNTARAQRQIQVGLSEAPCKAQLTTSRHSWSPSLGHCKSKADPNLVWVFLEYRNRQITD